MINDKDIKEERYRSTGNGGQNVNKLETAIRLTHIPTGIQASCQDQRHQSQNRKLAREELERRVDSFYNGEKQRARNEARKQAIANGVVRTYHYGRNTVTDHRTGIKAKLDKVLGGMLELLKEENSES